MGGIVDRLDRRRFTPIVACTQPGLTRIRQHLANRDTALVPLPHHFGHALDRLRAEQLDLLYFWEVGTDSTNYFLAFSRLAPVQCTGWGWPISSAAPEIDFHLTSEALAPAAADAYFRERLVRLPGLPAFAPRLRAQPSASPPESFGLPAGATLYLCPQNLRKVHPDFDEILGGILRSDPQGIAAFVHDRSPLFGAALQRRWRRTLPDVLERLVLLPRRRPDDYIRLVASARVILDTPHFGGSNTAYDHVAAGVPAVTMPGDTPASRYTAALYAAMQIDGGIADSPSAYVALALRLANDDAARAELVAAIRAAAPAVFETPVAVDQLADCFAAAITAAGTDRHDRHAEAQSPRRERA
jgi:predicted O-linked N-acetylglucosamine transferase (SPINDLY family)